MELAICVRNVPASVVADIGRFAEDHGYAEVYLPDGAHSGMADQEGRLVGRDRVRGARGPLLCDADSSGHPRRCRAPHAPPPLVADSGGHTLRALLP